MGSLISKIHSIFASASAGFEKARKAANALSDYESRIAKLEDDLIQIKLMLAGVLALVALLVIRAFAS